GAQHAGMGLALRAGFPEFAAGFDAACAELDRSLDRPLLEVLESGDPLADMALAHPALFALQVGLTRLFASWGVRPEAVVGHSIGEWAAAHAAGAVPLADAARAVVVRGRLLDRLPTTGAMAAVEADEDELRPLLGERVGVAAVNAPRSLVVSGDADEVDRVVSAVGSWGRRTSRLAITRAAHSPHVDAVLDEFERELSALRFTAPGLPFVSAVTGRPVERPDAAYWRSQLRLPVRFADAAAALDAPVVLELGPAAVLSALVDGPVAVPALRAGRAECHAVVDALGALWAAGVPVDWAGWFAGSGARRVDLPPHPFRRKRFWLEQSAVAAGAHPVLAHEVEVGGAGRLVLSGRWRGGASALAELAIHAGDRVGCPLVAELVVEREPEAGDVQVVVEPDRSFTVHTRARDTWKRCAHGVLALAARPAPFAFDGADATAEVADAGRFTVHPDLLDAAVRALGPGDAVRWRGLRLHASGATAVRIKVDGDRVLMSAVDGQPVLSAQIALGRLAPPVDPPVFGIDRVPITVERGRPRETPVRVTGPDDGPGARAAALRALDLVKAHLAADRADRLVLLAPLDALATAPLRGLVRAAHAEAPDRVALITTDDHPASRALLGDVIASGEPEADLRAGVVTVPRVVRVEPALAAPWRPGTVLVTGGEG
ncbi:acyltransferase domain-containing protein, partial [Actinosynnema sp.]|uniref:acyltransferase domain-containing protein n=1 Tax=Actinosynnema sp. TaxID=1872144 RepID=UPI003F82A0CD